MLARIVLVALLILSSATFADEDTDRRHTRAAVAILAVAGVACVVIVSVAAVRRKERQEQADRELEQIRTARATVGLRISF